jgi:quercetin dioxygenase-like cupin family protein
MNEMTTVTEVLSILRDRGYTTDFNLSDNCLACHGNSLQIHPEEFVVDEYFRFEGPSDPGDATIIYAISSTQHNVKGVLLNGYGVYGNTLTDDMVKALDAKASEAENASVRSTAQRPEGSRNLDATLLDIDSPAFRKQIKEEPTWQTSDRNSITLFKNDSLRMVLIALHKGAELKTHTAPGIINVQVMEGRITFSTAERSVDLTEGKVAVLHTGIPHSVAAIEESVFLLTIATNN